MLSKPNRLNLRFHRRRLGQEGQVSHSSFFTLITAPAEATRFAILVSKKLTKSAVARNHLKRQISEFLRKNIDSLNLNKDILIIPKKNALEADPKLLQENLLKMLKSLS